MSPVSPFGESNVSELLPIMENSEQSENITYFSDSHLKLSYDELLSMQAQNDMKKMLFNQLSDGEIKEENSSREDFDDSQTYLEQNRFKQKFDEISSDPTYNSDLEDDSICLKGTFSDEPGSGLKI